MEKKKIDAFIIPQHFRKNDYSIADKATEQIAVTVIPL
jgi:hypothetical protein